MAQNRGKIHTLALTLILLGIGGLLFALTRIGVDPSEEPEDVRVVASAYVEAAETAVVAPEAALVRQSVGGVTELVVDVLDPEGTPDLRARVEATSPGGEILPAKLAPATWKDLAAGAWTVRVTSSSFLTELRTLEVKEGERCTLAVSQRYGVRVRGRITNMGGEPAPNKLVWFLREGQANPSDAKRSGIVGEYASASSGSKGSFESPLLEPGMVRVLTANPNRSGPAFESMKFLTVGEDREVDIILPGGGKVTIQVHGFNPKDDRERPSVTLLAQSGAGKDPDARRTSRAAPWAPLRRVPLGDDGLVTISTASPGNVYKVQLQSARMIYTSETTFEFRKGRSYLITTTLPPKPLEVAVTKSARGGNRQGRQALQPPLDIQVSEQHASGTGGGPGVHWR